MNLQAVRNNLSGSSLLLTGVLLVGLVLLSLTSGGGIIRGQGLHSLLLYMCVPILIGLSQMVVLAVGQLNLAIGAMGGVTCAVMAVSMASLNLPVWLTLIGGLLVSTLIGAINGLLVAFTELHGFIVTLATMTILLGVQYALVSSYTIDDYSSVLKSFGQQTLGSIPYVFIFTVLVAAMVSAFFSRSVSGREILATGGAKQAAELSGISTAKSLVLAYTVAGLLIGVAALVSMTTLTGVNRTVGGDWLLPSFAAPIIAGVLLTGGAVSIYGTIMAAAILRLVDMARAQFLLDPSWTNFTIGTVVLATVLINEVRERRRVKDSLKQGSPR